MKQMVDKHGNKLTRIGHYWMSSNFERFWELLCAAPENAVIISAGLDGKIYSKTKAYIASTRLAASRKFSDGNWYFLDPETQIAYPEKK